MEVWIIVFRYGVSKVFVIVIEKGRNILCEKIHVICCESSAVYEKNWLHICIVAFIGYEIQWNKKSLQSFDYLNFIRL